MRVGVNALLLSGRAGYRQSGVSRYVERLLRALPEALPDGELVVYAGRDVVPPSPALARSWRRAGWPVEHPAARIAWEQAALPVAARRAGLDLFHGTVNVVPRLLPCPSVVTIHDLAFLRWPEQVPARRYRYLSSAVRAAVRRAARVIAVSQSTKADIVALLDVDPDRITVTYLGVDERFRPVKGADLAAFLAEQGIVRPFALFVGNLEPRKNLPTLLRAFARIASEVPHELVLIGAEGWLTEEMHATLDGLGLGNRVRLAGFVEDADLPAWYSAADLFVYPSLYEGFGLPALEAMACGTPVVTSNLSALPEVVGDAALTVDPSDVEALAGAMRKVLADPTLGAGLAGLGRQRAAAFTWQRTAAATAAVYREVAS